MLWKTFLFSTFLFIRFPHGVLSAVPSQVIIGAICPTSRKRVCSVAIKAAVDYVNGEASLLPSTQIKYIINDTKELEPLGNAQKACYQISKGVTAIIGPYTSTDVKAVSTIINHLKIPIFTPAATNPAFFADHTSFPFLLRMLPSEVVGARVIVEIFETFFWRRFAMLSSNTDFGNGAAAQFNLIALEKKWSVVTTQKFEALSNVSALNVRNQLNAIHVNGIRVVLLVGAAQYIPIIMEQAKELDMINGWAWIVMDASLTVNSPIPEEIIGLVGIRTVINRGTLHPVFTSNLTAAGIDTTVANFDALKTFDAVIAFAKGLHNFLQDGHSHSTESPTCGSCAGDSSFKTNGDILMTYLRKVQVNGASDFLNFTKEGSPGLAEYEVVNLQKDGWTAVGSWNTSEGLSLDTTKRLMTWPGATTDHPVDVAYQFGNRTLSIVTIMEPGFVELKQGKTVSDPDPFEGFCIDLLKKLAKDMHFKYTLDLVKDGNYGRYVNGRWNGMVGDLADKKYDMALAPIAISKSRAEVIDFSKPYMDLGLTVLMKLPQKPETNIFGFVDPFSLNVWLSCFAFMVAIAFISLFMDKVSPNGHYGLVVQNQLEEERDDSEVQEELDETTYMNMTNSMWFSIGALVQQGGDVLPRSISGRTVAAFWWAASMIIIATYTANLAAFLTFNRMKLSITSIEQLGTQMDVKYGTVKNSPALHYFENSRLPSFNGMYQFMKGRNTLVPNFTTGIQKVKTENYAFIYDSLLLYTETYKKPCDVFTVGKIFGNFGYGLAFQKNSLLRIRFSLEILHLREKAFILGLERRWFKNRGDCTPDLSILKTTTGQLTLEDMIGVLYCVYAGIGLGVILVVIEWCVASYWEVDRTDPMKPNSWRAAMRRRMRRIWENLRNNWPENLKCKKSISKNAVSVIVSKNETLDTKENVEAGVNNKGYNQEGSMIHPFVVEEE